MKAGDEKSSWECDSELVKPFPRCRDSINQAHPQAGLDPGSGRNCFNYMPGKMSLMDYPHVNHLEIEKSMLFMKALMCNAEESKHSGEKAFWIGGTEEKQSYFHAWVFSRQAFAYFCSISYATPCNMISVLFIRLSSQVTVFYISPSFMLPIFINSLFSNSSTGPAFIYPFNSMVNTNLKTGCYF